jgi:hypothetical protein
VFRVFFSAGRETFHLFQGGARRGSEAPATGIAEWAASEVIAGPSCIAWSFNR